LYHYIGSKFELLFQIHESFIEPLLAAARPILDEPLTPPEALRQLSRTLMQTITNYRDEVTVFLHEWRVVAGDPRWQTIRAKRREFERIVDQILERGVRQGYFAIPQRRLTVLAFLGMHNYSYQWFRPEGPCSAGEIAEAFCQTFLQGITVKRETGG
jgi:AcrR family transcriptional regulator